MLCFCVRGYCYLQDYVSIIYYMKTAGEVVIPGCMRHSMEDKGPHIDQSHCSKCLIQLCTVYGSDEVIIKSPSARMRSEGYKSVDV